MDLREGGGQSRRFLALKENTSSLANKLQKSSKHGGYHAMRSLQPHHPTKTATSKNDGRCTVCNFEARRANLVKLSDVQIDDDSRRELASLFGDRQGRCFFCTHCANSLANYFMDLQELNEDYVRSALLLIGRDAGMAFTVDNYEVSQIIVQIEGKCLSGSCNKFQTVLGIDVKPW